MADIVGLYKNEPKCRRGVLDATSSTGDILTTVLGLKLGACGVWL
jgi:hypothetical protein